MADHEEDDIRIGRVFHVTRLTGEEEYEDGDSQIEEEESGEGSEESNFYAAELSDSEELHQILDTRAMSGGSEDYEASHASLDHAIAHSTAMRHAPSKGSARLEKVKRGEFVNTMTMLAGREFNVSGNGRFSRAECCHVGARYLPSDGPSIVEDMNSRAYIGQFSGDGTLFVAGFQDRRIRIYDVDKGWTVRKDIQARNLRWTVTDTALSPDQRFLVYASITPVVYLVNVSSESGGVTSLANITDIHEGLNFASDSRGDVFGIWSLQFSEDGRELVAGSNDKCIYVYDLEANKPVLRINAHKDDVNAVVFADESCHLIFSGSDDNTCKVWDRRCFTLRGRPAGQLVGHLEGITFIDSRKDGRYFISNGKDQTIKLWDIRKMTSGPTTCKKDRKIPSFAWDYRWMDYPGMGRDVRHPYDQSLMTYKGHLVLRTLIRCYFSPLASTGQKYIYTGSHDGCVYIYDLVTGKQMSRLSYHRGTVRDCSWHPTEPMLVSSSWDGQLAKWEHRFGDKSTIEAPHISYDDFFD
ncbi:LEC14B protein isoform X2 [Physcomitrium patens]|uniref:LEC14B homolog n=1 Tax=Physcomitrium patens TaxID=3218 RepID=A0A7I4A2G8_PHYPA|nr:LEC14B protein-like isoform X2 [Physcomitrium patens]XP_024386774.1 LEC14B protein-like isoform X2 [Physcomitrium patens]XP_024386775.1 LEC14B protein-like isoform X2 [Physcomitrium patens]XP_024386777.1 LEC14B protein-like isoform X2 [Physcomitrium patens]|eukprot:XP_024386773.1 LEC14B protein-like isoform X2 [Physcomitrella patens]